MAKKKRTITDEELEAILQMYRDELKELEEIKARNSARYSAMSEEELIATLAGETKQVYEHATGKKYPDDYAEDEDEDKDDK